MSDEDEKKLELAKNWKAFEELINSTDYPKDSADVKISENKLKKALERGGYKWNEDKTKIIAGNFNKSMYKDLTFHTLIDKVNKVKAKSSSTATTLIPKDGVKKFVAKARADLAKWITPPSIRESEGEKITQLEKMLSDAEKLEGEFEAKEARAIGIYLEKKWKEEEKKKKKEEEKPKKEDFEKRLKEITRQKFKLGKLDQNKLESQLKIEKGDKVFHLDDLLSKFPKLKDEDKIKETRQDIEFLLSNAENIIKKAKPVQRAFSPDHFDKEEDEEEEEEEEEEEDENEESDDDSDASYEKRPPLKKREREEESLKSILAIAIDAKREQRQKLFELCDKKEEFKEYLKTFGSKKRYRTIMCVDGKEVPGFMNGPDLFNTRYEAEEKVKFIENEMAGGNKNVKVIIREEEEEK